MNNNKNVLAANIIFDQRLNIKKLLKFPQNLKPESIEESYKIQNELKVLYLSLNNNYTVGKKVGGTNILAQKKLNIKESFYGNLFSRFTDISGCKLQSNKFFKPFIEPEISFRIKDDVNINKGPFCCNDVDNLFDCMFPSFEIVDFRFDEDIQKVDIKNLIMSNGASEFYIKGSKIYNLHDINLSDQNIKLFFNNKIVSEGNTNLVLKNPINSAIWLINKLISIGEPMLKGQFISTGTCTKAIKLIKNSTVKADFGKLGIVEFTYI